MVPIGVIDSGTLMTRRYGGSLTTKAPGSRKQCVVLIHFVVSLAISLCVKNMLNLLRIVIFWDSDKNVKI